MTVGKVAIKLPTQLCQICGEGDLDGIMCSHSHFLCNSCMTSYVRSLNEDPALSMFHQRQGRIVCPVPVQSGSLVKCGAVYSNGEVCKHVLDCKVLDDYIEGLQNYQKSTLVAEHNEQLLQTLIEKQQSETRSAELQRQRKQLELQQLTECIRSSCPDARQCRSCGVGPILMDTHCDNLGSHHLQAAPGGGLYNNSCRNCGVLTSSKNLLPRWDGKLPASLTTSSEVTAAAAVPPPITRLAKLENDLELTPEDFESSTLLSEIRRQLASNIQPSPAMIASLRSVVQSERRLSSQRNNTAANASTTPLPTPLSATPPLPLPLPDVPQVVESALVNPKPRLLRAALARFCIGDLQSRLLAVHVRQHNHLLYPSPPQRISAPCNTCRSVNRSSAYFCPKCAFDICNACLGPSRPNRAGVMMYRGNDGTGRYFCGRHVAIPGSETGRCGPNNGRQCLDCI